MIDHEAIFAFFTEEVRTQGGAPIRSVVAYGSALTDEFRPGISDYNFLVVAEPIEMDLLDRFAARTGKWRKKKIAPPLLITPAFVERALDSYPMEFLSMAARHRVLFGEDLLTALVFKEEHVRLQCEREIWGKILLFRRAYLESEGAPRRLQRVIERGYSSIVAIYRGMLFLKGGPWQATGEEFRAACDSFLGVSSTLLRDLQAVRGQRSAPSRDQIQGQMGQVLAALDKLALEVDQW